MRRFRSYSLVSVLCILLAPALRAQAAPRFEIVVPAAALGRPITGRAYVIISRVPSSDLRNDFGSPDQPDPFFGQDMAQVPAGHATIIDAASNGYPLQSLRELPAGDYFVQAFVNVYTRFPRADGHVIWAHMDQWEGQQLNQSPGNLYSDVRRVHLDPARGYSIRLEASHLIPPVTMPPDTPWVKHIRMRSRLLTRFWGHPMYIGATVLLPAGYDRHPEQYYPVIYEQGHFTLDPPLSMRMQPGKGGVAWQQEAYRTFQAWSGPDFPRMIAVTFQHPTPYYDDSYAVNSANNGPYGDALMHELIPYIESHFRIIREPWARVLTGGSTGGWESLALQLYYPAFFGGTFTGYPDPIDFRHYQLVNLYRDRNAFEPPDSPVDRERPFTRDEEGQVLATERQESQLEAALGSHGRSGQQLDAWVSVFGPVGPEGYPQPLWNLQTGRIDPAVANSMRDQGYDLRAYLAKNWPRLGPQLRGKIFLWVGDMDSYYLNLAVYDMQDFLRQHPEAGAQFTYGRPEKPHGWTPWTEPQLIRMMAHHVAKSAPAGADLRGWYRAGQAKAGKASEPTH
jgi:hypothetical protein